MENKEAFVKIDGTIVSLAAKKAYDEALIHDDKVKEREEADRLIEKEDRKLRNEASYYFQTAEAQEVFRSHVNKFCVEDKVVPTLFPTLFGVKYEKVLKVGKFWEMIGHLSSIDARWKYLDASYMVGCYGVLSKCAKGEDFNLFAGYDCNMWRMQSYNYLAPRFEKYFDLKGDVFLPISEYNVLKPYMEDL